MEIIDAGGGYLKCVDDFCYLGDMIEAGGGGEASIIMRVRCGWKKFRELLPLLTMKGLSLCLKGRLYAACVRSVVLYGSETWGMREGDIRRFEYTEMRMVRWMSNVTLRDRTPSAELRGRLGIEYC